MQCVKVIWQNVSDQCVMFGTNLSGRKYHPAAHEQISSWWHRNAPNAKCLATRRHRHHNMQLVAAIVLPHPSPPNAFVNSLNCSLKVFVFSCGSFFSSQIKTSVSVFLFVHLRLVAAFNIHFSQFGALLVLNYRAVSTHETPLPLSPVSFANDAKRTVFEYCGACDHFELVAPREPLPKVPFEMKRKLCVS